MLTRAFSALSPGRKHGDRGRSSDASHHEKRSKSADGAHTGKKKASKSKAHAAEEWTWSLENVDLESALQHFFSDYEQSRISLVPVIIKQFEADEVYLLRELCKKYALSRSEMQYYLDAASHSSSNAHGHVERGRHHHHHLSDDEVHVTATKHTPPTQHHHQHQQHQQHQQHHHSSSVLKSTYVPSESKHRARSASPTLRSMQAHGPHTLKAPSHAEEREDPHKDRQHHRHEHHQHQHQRHRRDEEEEPQHHSMHSHKDANDKHRHHHDSSAHGHGHGQHYSQAQAQAQAQAHAYESHSRESESSDNRHRHHHHQHQPQQHHHHHRHQQMHSDDDDDESDLPDPDVDEYFSQSSDDEHEMHTAMLRWRLDAAERREEEARREQQAAMRILEDNRGLLSLVAAMVTLAQSPNTNLTQTFPASPLQLLASSAPMSAPTPALLPASGSVAPNPQAHPQSQSQPQSQAQTQPKRAAKVPLLSSATPAPSSGAASLEASEDEDEDEDGEEQERQRQLQRKREEEEKHTQRQLRKLKKQQSQEAENAAASAAAAAAAEATAQAAAQPPPRSKTQPAPSKSKEKSKEEQEKEKEKEKNKKDGGATTKDAAFAAQLAALQAELAETRLALTRTSQERLEAVRLLEAASAEGMKSMAGDIAAALIEGRAQSPGEAEDVLTRYFEAYKEGISSSPDSRKPTSATSAQQEPSEATKEHLAWLQEQQRLPVPVPALSRAERADLLAINRHARAGASSSSSSGSASTPAVPVPSLSPTAPAPLYLDTSSNGEDDEDGWFRAGSQAYAEQGPDSYPYQHPSYRTAEEPTGWYSPPPPGAGPSQAERAYMLSTASNSRRVLGSPPPLHVAVPGGAPHQYAPAPSAPPGFGRGRSPARASSPSAAAAAAAARELPRDYHWHKETGPLLERAERARGGSPAPAPKRAMSTGLSVNGFGSHNLPRYGRSRTPSPAPSVRSRSRGASVSEDFVDAQYELARHAAQLQQQASDATLALGERALLHAQSRAGEAAQAAASRQRRGSEDDWVECWDQRTRRFYYHSRSRGQSVWGQAPLPMPVPSPVSAVSAAAGRGVVDQTEYIRALEGLLRQQQQQQMSSASRGSPGQLRISTSGASQLRSQMLPFS